MNPFNMARNFVRQSRKDRKRAMQHEAEDRATLDNARRMRAAVKAEMERLSGLSPTETDLQIGDILGVTQAQLTDDTVTSDRVRFAGKRTLSLDAFAESGFEYSESARPSYATLEEQEALEFGMEPLMLALPMDYRDALRLIFRERMTYREAAAVLRLPLRSTQRRVEGGIKELRKELLADSGITEEQLANEPVRTKPPVPKSERPRVENTMDMSASRLARLDPGAKVPRRALTLRERNWLTKMARGDLDVA